MNDRGSLALQIVSGRLFQCSGPLMWLVMLWWHGGDVVSDVVVGVRFICKNSGVLYESDLIQVGVKCEFRQHLARLSLFYGNKTAVSLKDFLPVINSEPPLSNHIFYTCYCIYSPISRSHV